jgi:serine protease AprX
MSKRKSIFQIIVTLVTAFVLIGGLGFVPASAQPFAGALQSVIVQGASTEQAAGLVAKYGGKVTSRLDIIYGVGARVPGNAMAALRNEPGIVRVTDNASTSLSEANYKKENKNTASTDYVDAIGTELAWQQGDLGQGVSVAVIDTGVAQHPDLKKGPNGKPRSVVVGWVDFVDGKKVPTDPNGHGTHVAGIIANATKGEDGEYNGIAPAVNLVGVRVLDNTGAGDYEKVIQGIQWVIAHKNEYNIKVINLSLHSLVQSPYWADPLDQAVMRAWAEGITVIVAGGNDGPKPMTISVPGNTPYVVTVGAFTDNYTPTDWNDDYIAEFSSAGPTLDGFVKPELVAPGAHMTSTMMPSSYIARNHDANWVSSQYFSMAGTSQAAAVVSGVTALVISQHPELTPDQVKYRLMITALPWINSDQSDVLYSVWQQGFGRVNPYDAIFSTDAEGSANQGLDVLADLNSGQHFEGYSYYDDATGTFRLHGFEDMTSKFGSWAGGFGSWAGGFGSWAGGFGSWAGGFGSWAGGFGSWAGGFGSWAGGFGSWAGKFGSWAGKFGSWAGGFGSWAGGFGSWAGGFGSWAGKFGSWAGGFGVWAGQLTDPTFIANFTHGVSPNVKTSSASIRWVEDR